MTVTRIRRSANCGDSDGWSVSLCMASGRSWRRGTTTSVTSTWCCEPGWPVIDPVTMPGLEAMRDPTRLTAAMTAAGLTEVRIVEDTQPAMIHADEFDDPNRLFTFNSQWQLLDPREQATILAAIESRRTGGEGLTVPSTALIATARRL